MKKSKQILKINDSNSQNKSGDSIAKIQDINRFNPISKKQSFQKKQPKYIQQKNHDPQFRCVTTLSPSPKNKENNHFSQEKKSYIFEKQKLDNNPNKIKIVENMINNLLTNQHQDSSVMNNHQILVVNLKKISTELQESQKKNNDLIQENKILLKENQRMVDFIGQQETKITELKSKHKEEFQNCMKKFQEIFFQSKEKNNQCEQQLSDMRRKVTEYQNNLVGPIFDMHEIQLIVENFSSQNYKEDDLKSFVQNVHTKIQKLIKMLNPFIIDMDLTLSLEQFGNQLKQELNDGNFQQESNENSTSIQVDDYQQQFNTNRMQQDSDIHIDQISSGEQNQICQNNDGNEIDISQQTMIFHSKKVSQNFLGVSYSSQVGSLQNSSLNSLYVEEPVIIVKQFEKTEQTPQFNSENQFFSNNRAQSKGSVLADKTSCINNSIDVVDRRVRTESEENIQNDEFVIGKFEFQGQNKNDLSFSKGEKIQVLKKSKNGWWIGLCKNKIGYFPSNYVESIIFQ